MLIVNKLLILKKGRRISCCRKLREKKTEIETGLLFKVLIFFFTMVTNLVIVEVAKKILLGDLK